MRIIFWQLLELDIKRQIDMYELVVNQEGSSEGCTEDSEISQLLDIVVECSRDTGRG